MKKTLLAFALATASFAAARAQAPAAAPAATAPAPAGYAEQLGATIEAVLHTGNPAELGELAAKLERAAAANPTDWLAPYYQAYALLLAARLSKAGLTAQDQLLDQGEAALARARQRKGDESELQALQALAYQLRLSLDPMQRYEQYGDLVYQSAETAKTINPANPRPYLILANQVNYTPEMYGGGAAKARPLYEAAKVKFEAFKPASALAPSWGQQQVLERLKAYDAPAASAARGK